MDKYKTNSFYIQMLKVGTKGGWEHTFRDRVEVMSWLQLILCPKQPTNMKLIFNFTTNINVLHIDEVENQISTIQHLEIKGKYNSKLYKWNIQNKIDLLEASKIKQSILQMIFWETNLLNQHSIPEIHRIFTLTETIQLIYCI